MKRGEEKKMEIRQNQIIEFTLDNIESIREGMGRYRDLLRQDLVNVGNEMDVLFTYRESEKLKALQACHGEETYLKALGKISMEDYSVREKTFESVSSEGIFFSHALKYEELLEDIVETAQEIVNYSRRHNDTWEMWADDMGVFGLDVLYLLAKKYPKYTYLIGGFIIPYWDNEHADYAFSYLGQIYREDGFTDHLMKAFCYCDSDQARLAILGIGYGYRLEEYFDLGEYFKKNPSKYELFKEMLIERYRVQEFLQYSKDDHTDRPIQKIYGVIMVSSNPEIGLYEDEDDYIKGLEGFFIEDSYDNESFELQQQIEGILGSSLVEDNSEEEEEVYEDEIWEDFFINGFQEGQRIWKYILSGEEKEILDTIVPTDIRALSRERELLFYKEKIQWFIGEYDTVREEFHRIFEGFIGEYYEEQEGDLRVVINGEDVSGRERVLRALDVFYKLLGEAAFTSDLFKLMISYRVMTVDEFVERYDLNKESSINHLSSLMCDPMAYIEYSNREDIDRIYRYMDSDRERARILFTGKTAQAIEEGREEKIFLRGDITQQRDAQMNILKGGLPKDARSISVVTYLLEREWKNSRSDELTKILTDYVEKNWLDLMMDEIEKHSSLAKDELESIKTHIVGRPAPPRELFMKALTEGRDALTEDEKALLNPNSSGVSDDEISNLLRERLKKSRKGKEYKIFNTIAKGYLLSLIPALYFGGFRVSLGSSRAMEKAIKLIIKIDPIMVMTFIHDMCYAQIEGYTSYDFRQDTRRFSQSEIIGLAVEIAKSKEDEYKPYVSMYIEAKEEPTRGMFREFSRGEFYEALSYLNTYDREGFLEEVSVMSPENVDYLEEFMMALREFTELNLDERLYTNKNDKKKLENEAFTMIKGYINGMDNMSEVLEKLKPTFSTDILVKTLWRIDEIYRERFLRLLVEIGVGGINCGISNLVIDEGYIDMWTYLEKMSGLGATATNLVQWGIEWGVEDALVIANRKEEIYPLVSSLPLNERENALNLAKESSEMIGFIGKMTEDNSARIRGMAVKIREQLI